MKIQKVRIGDKEVMPFTNPSGEFMTDAFGAAHLMGMIPQLEMWTMKTTGLCERVMPTEELMRDNPNGYEFGARDPMFVQVDEGTYVNAIKLINDGASKTRAKIIESGVRKGNRVIMCSIHGKNPLEYAQAAEALFDVADGFELNVSCPHAEKTGMVLGQDPDMVYRIVRAVKGVAKGKPVFVKPPNIATVGNSVRAAVAGGCDGITGMNTIGPVDCAYLWNGKGGKSGLGIRDISMKRIAEIREIVGSDMTITYMGGLRDADDIRACIRAGANIFAPGSAALTGMDDNEMQEYFEILAEDIEYDDNYSRNLIKPVDMTYRSVRIVGIDDCACDFKVMRTNISMDAKAGQFVFAMIPGSGEEHTEEKPFSVMDDDPLTLGVKTRGGFTRKLNSLHVGDTFYVRGPYGKSVPEIDGKYVTLVGGGCGIVGLYLVAKQLSRNNRLQTFMGASDMQHIPYLKEFEKHGQVFIITDSGDVGRKGFVRDLLADGEFADGTYFFNCGPAAMVDSVLELELKSTTPDRAYSSRDFMTHCGVGVCGQCVDRHGVRTCMRGPYMKS